LKIFYDGAIFLQQWKGGVNRIFEELSARLPGIESGVEMNLHRFPETFHRSLLKRECFMMPKLGAMLRKYDALSMPSKVNGFRPDIFHTTYYRMPESIKCRKVITVYDMIHEKFSKEFASPEKFLRLKKHCVANADQVIAISEHTKNDIVELYGTNPEKISVVHLAAGDTFKPANNEEKRALRQKYGTNRPFILYVGQRGGYKNFITLLKAFSIWKNKDEYELVCVGGKSWSSEEAGLISKNGLLDRIKLFGFMDDRELMALYSLAAAFVYPSKYEGFGIPLVEAMACGTPIVAANISSIPEIAGNAALYFDPDSEASLADAIHKVVFDENFKNSLIKNGFKRKESFNWDKTARETYDVYNKLLQG